MSIEIQISAQRFQSGSQTNKRTLVLNSQYQPVTVEDFVLDAVQKQGYEGFFTENIFWWQMMAILYWDAILKPFHDNKPFYDRNDLPPEILQPVEWNKKSKFVTNYSEILIKLGLSNKLQEHLIKRWELPIQHNVRWFIDSPYRLSNYLFALDNLRTQQIIALVGRLAVNYSLIRNGLPDLFVVSTKETKFIEVKQKDEKISSVQKDWHIFLESNGIRVEVWRVLC